LSESRDSRPRARVIRGSRAKATPTAALDIDLNTVVVAGAPAGRDRIEAAVAEGYREGYQQGLGQGRAEGLAASRAAGAEQRQRLAVVTEALARAAEQLAHHDVAATEVLGAQAVDLAFQLAEAILGRELALSAEPGREAVTRALALTPAGQDAVLRLHPDDALMVGDLGSLAAGRQVTIVPDAAVERGGCLLETGDSRIDAQIGPALARARAVLEGEVPR
jgi:flagellar assembly protein FliH